MDEIKEAYDLVNQNNPGEYHVNKIYVLIQPLRDGAQGENLFYS